MKYFLPGLVYSTAIYALLATAEPTPKETEGLDLADVKKEPSRSVLTLDNNTKNDESPKMSISLRDFPETIDMSFTLNEKNFGRTIHVEVPDSTLSSIGESVDLEKLVPNVSGLLTDPTVFLNSLSAFGNAYQWVHAIGESNDSQIASRASPKEIDADMPDILDVLLTAMDRELFDDISQHSPARNHPVIDADLPDKVSTLANTISQKLASKDFTHTHEDSLAQNKADSSDISITPFALDGEQLMQTLIGIIEGLDANKDETDSWTQDSNELTPTPDMPLDLYVFSGISNATNLFQMFGKPMVELFNFFQSTIESDASLQMPEVRWSSSVESFEESGRQENIQVTDACTLIVDAANMHAPAHISVRVQGPNVVIQTTTAFNQSDSSNESAGLKQTVTFAMLSPNSEMHEAVSSKLRRAKISTTTSMEIPIPVYCNSQNPRTHTNRNNKSAALIFSRAHVDERQHQVHAYLQQQKHQLQHELFGELNLEKQNEMHQKKQLGVHEIELKKEKVTTVEL